MFQPNNSSSRSSESRYQPQIEELEELSLPACSLTGGVLTVNGTNLNDDIWVRPTPTGNIVEVIHTNSRGAQNCFFWATSVNRLVINGGDGSDVIQSDLSVQTTINGGNGNDTVFGGVGNDTIYGGNGHDDLFGWFGNDRLYGEGGDDWLFGEAGNDVLDGGYDDGFADRLNGGSGSDVYVQHYYAYWYGSIDWQNEWLDGFNSSEDCIHWSGHGADWLWAVGHNGTC